MAQDFVLGSRVTYQKLRGSIFLIDELPRIQFGVRGARDLIGIEQGTLSLEFRFPLRRDFRWEPFDGIGLGEWFIFKDLRGFLFAQGGYSGFGIRDALDRQFDAEIVGAGLRFDFSFMPWPIVALRVALRVEVWGAFVTQEIEPNRGAYGVAIILGF